MTSARGLVWALVVGASLSVAACGEAMAPGQGGVTGDATLEVTVAPLTLAGVSDACWGLTVYNGAIANLGGAETVTARGGVCATAFGDGLGSVSYVAPCDASGGGAGRINTVELVLERLCEGGACDGAGAGLAAGSWVNPCPAEVPCRREALCADNRDTSVVFDVTVLRNAQQGFFDVAVSFEDVFCSAKLDCEEDDGSAIELLHDPATGQRASTLVFGFACTGGGVGADTVLNWQDFNVTCTDVNGTVDSYVFDPTGEGNLNPDFGAAPRVIFQAASFAGSEPLGGYAKGYWNVAIGVDEAVVAAEGMTCSVDVQGAVSDGALFDHQLAPDAVYPYLRWNQTLYAGGARVCDQHEVNAGDGAVSTVYYRPGGPTVRFPRCYEVGVDAFCDPCDDGDPCTADAPLDGGGCEHVYTCASVTDMGIVFDGYSVLADDGTVFVGGRIYPGDNGAAYYSDNRVYKSYALDSADLSILWGGIGTAELGELANASQRCDKNSGGSVTEPAFSEVTGQIMTYGDWNNGQIGDVCASIFARDAATGSLNWYKEPGGPHPRYSIALTDTHAFYGGFNGTSRKFNLATGAIEATFSLGDPVVWDTGGTPTIASGGDLVIGAPQKRVARFQQDGTKLWENANIRSDIQLTAGDHVVGWDSEDGYTDLIVVDFADGYVLWSRPVPGDEAWPVLTDAAGHLYLGHQDGARSYDAAGALRWSVPIDGLAEAQFLGDDGRFYVRTDTRLYALDTADGATAWTFDVLDVQVEINGVMTDNRFAADASLLEGGDIFMGDHGGNVYRLAADLDYALAPWPRIRGNRRHSARNYDYAPMP